MDPDPVSESGDRKPDPVSGTGSGVRNLKIGLLSIRELFTILIAALKNPVLECRNSELPGTALNIAD